MRGTLRLCGAALLCALALASCGSGSPTQTTSAARPKFEGIPWATSSGASITFENGKASGSTGCNRFSASYSGKGSELKFGPIATTQMACIGANQADEQAFLRKLEQVRTVEVTNGTLILGDADGKELLRFAEASPTGNWTVTSFLQADAVSSPIVGTKITADFDGQGNLTGFAGCNDYHGAYTLTQNQLQILALGATTKHCAEPKGVMEQEQQYLSVLPKTASYELQGDKLTLLTPQHTIVATYTRAPG